MHWVQIRSININSAFFHFYFIIIIICLSLSSFCHSWIPFYLFHSSHSPSPPIMLAIRYLQLWNPLHQCQSGQPHRWVQRCPLQEVRGSDRLSRGGCWSWGGAAEHHSMTYNPKASFTSIPVGVCALNCRHQGLMETRTGLTKCPPETRTWTFLTSATGCKETHLSQLLLLRLFELQKQNKKNTKCHSGWTVAFKRKDWKIDKYYIKRYFYLWFIFAYLLYFVFFFLSAMRYVSHSFLVLLFSFAL